MACGQLEFVGVKQDYLQMHKPQNLKQSGRGQGADGGRGWQQTQARKTIFTQFQERKIAQTGGRSSSSSKINVNKARKSTRAAATTRRTTRTSTTGSAISSTQGSKPARQQATRQAESRGEAAKGGQAAGKGRQV